MRYSPQTQYTGGRRSQRLSAPIATMCFTTTTPAVATTTTDNNINNETVIKREPLAYTRTRRAVQKTKNIL